MTTCVEFVNALEALEIEGVVTRCPSGPLPKFGTEQLPAQFVLPTVGDVPALLTFGVGEYWPALSADLAVIIEPYPQSLPGANFDATVAMIDAMNAAAKLSSCGAIAKTASWTIKMAEIRVAGVAYWGVVGTFTGHG